MSAEPQRSSGEPENWRDVVSRFKHEYAEAIAEARVSAEHTGTEGWQHLYQNFHRENREARRGHADRLKELGQSLELSEIGEDGEKTLSDLKKLIQQRREEREIFERRTVDPVRGSVEKCHRVIQECREQADADEHRHPLVNVRLVETLLLEIAKVDRPYFDADTGRIEIKPPTD